MTTVDKTALLPSDDALRALIDSLDDDILDASDEEVEAELRAAGWTDEMRDRALARIGDLIAKRRASRPK